MVLALKLASLLLAADPQLRISLVKVTARESKSAVARTLKEQLEPMKGCYDLALKDNPALEGDVKAAFDVVAGTESAGEVTALPGGVEDPTLGSCVRARLTSTTWPKTRKGNHVEVVLHFATAK